jgi:hypothetical protein
MTELNRSLMKNQRTYVLVAVLIFALSALAWTYWPTLHRLTATRLPEPTPVKHESLPLATRVAHLFWSGRYTEFEAMLEQSLANVANPSVIESLLSSTCDRAPSAQREGERWLAAKPTALWPQLCLGRAFVKHGLQRRGTEFSMNTRAEQFMRIEVAPQIWTVG